VDSALEPPLPDRISVRKLETQDWCNMRAIKPEIRAQKLNAYKFNDFSKIRVY
jgi:hypothetical protein